MSDTAQIRDGIAIDIGGMPIFLRTDDLAFQQLLRDRYEGFVSPTAKTAFEFDIDLQSSAHGKGPDEDVRVSRQGAQWFLQRGDFRANWDPARGRGSVSQSPNPYAIDSVLRIVHTLILAREGGFLVHAASAIRNGKAFLFAGISGAGKTTISRLAPSDATLLTDEISYVRRQESGYQACGTPFAGELAKVGENVSAPLAAVLLLEKGPENRLEVVDEKSAVRCLLRNILFFAEDQEMVRMVFQSACDFVERVPVKRLIFTPDQRVWDLIV